MANEPERPIEKLLRTAAQKRCDQAGAPLELHPVNRRLLQDEVARVFPKAHRQSSSFVSVLVQMWPRFAGGLAILAVLAMAVWLLVPLPGNDKSETLLVKQLSESRSAPASAPSQAIAPAPATIAPSPAPEAKSEAVVGAFDEVERVNRATPARRAIADKQPIELADSGAPGKLKDADLIAPAATAQRADREAATRRQVASSGGIPATAPAPAGAVTEESRYGVSGGSAAAASAPPAPAAALSLNNRPADAPAVAVARSENAAVAPLEQPAGYESAAATVNGNRAKHSLASTDGLPKVSPELFKATSETTVGQKFMRVGADSKEYSSLAEKSGAGTAVLASFKLQQIGNELQVIDGDGSVYKGVLQPVSARRARALGLESAAATGPSQPADRAYEEQSVLKPGSDRLPNQAYSFRVAGTNRSLNKKVVFTGNLLTVTNVSLLLPALTNLATADSLAGKLTEPAQQSSVPLLRSRISGKVVVGSGKPIEINALPSNP